MEQPTFTVTDNGFLLTIDGVSYILEWIENMLKVSGPDVCYFILETARGIEKADCALKTFSILIGNN